MPLIHETMFYELMWRRWGQGGAPLPWWAQQYFRRWTDNYDEGLFNSKQAAFASNAFYRYWHMVGVKDYEQESLIGQAGEVEPVYEEYSLSFFLFDPSTRSLQFPQFPQPRDGRPGLTQELEDGYLPIVLTTYRSAFGIDVRQKVLATTVGSDQRAVVLVRFTATLTQATPKSTWLCVAVSPGGPTGFHRHDRAGRYTYDRRLGFLRYIDSDQRVDVNSSWGPVFDRRPDHLGVYGNTSSLDPETYLSRSPYRDLADRGALNGETRATDYVAGLCIGAFGWDMTLSPGSPTFSLDIRLPVDDYRGAGDLQELRTANADALEAGNRTFWTNKLDKSGFQVRLPATVRHLFDLYRTCRANLLILSDDGEIHPGPTIYDSFWVRDSSVEGIACALSGDGNLAERQFGFHYPNVFQFGFDRVGPVSIHGFFGGEHEQNDQEWDANGQALWAIGRFDRINGTGRAFGAGMFEPYVVEGARWLRDNRSGFGLLHSGWSAEHIGDKDKPHYWDDFWALAGLWEAGHLANRIGAPQAQEVWATYHDLARATVDSIRWVLNEQRARGMWETFIPTGPADVGRLDSTIIGTLAYFHPCRLHMGTKLGFDIDQAARMTLETIWSHFMEGGFRHDAAWRCYGPYLTLQLAHAFLLIGDLDRMDQCLSWAVGNAAYAKVSRQAGDAGFPWQVTLGAWNEQHCYPIAKDFAEFPERWYMGDIPHGWACAEFMWLMRDISFYEADEESDAHIYVAPGILPHWWGSHESIEVSDAPTVFGKPFGFHLDHDSQARSITINITQRPPAHVRFVYPCRMGAGVQSVTVDGQALTVTGRDVQLPAGMREAVIVYQE